MKNREVINEHDQTKRMLDVMRYGLIKEEQGGDEMSDNEESPDTISPSKNDSVYKEEEKKTIAVREGRKVKFGIKLDSFIKEIKHFFNFNIFFLVLLNIY